MDLNPTGRVYFFDHNTETTTWDDPRPPKSSDVNVPSYDGRTTTQHDNE